MSHTATGNIDGSAKHQFFKGAYKTENSCCPGQGKNKLKMRALTVNVTPSGSRELRYEPNYPKPTPGPGQVLVRVLLAGICGTDHHVMEDFKTIDRQLVLGHEFVGVISEFGPECPVLTANGETLKTNDRVVSEINCVPHTVKNMATRPRTAAERAHDTNRCALGLFGSDGAFADYIVVPFENLHRVPDNVPTRVAVFAEPIAAACQVLKQVHVKPTDRVAVLGAGKLGWVVAKVLAASAVDVCMVTRRKTGSIPQYIRRYNLNDDGNTIPVVSLLHPENYNGDEANHGQPKSLFDAFDIVIDCSGSPKGLKTAIQMVKPHGTIVLKSTCGPSLSHPLDLTPVVIKEVGIIGSRCGPFDAALRLLKNGLLDVDSLITEVFRIEDGQLAFAKSREEGVLKILIEL